MSEALQPVEGVHFPKPKLGTFRRERDEQPADLFNGNDYPVLADCSGCDGILRAGSFLAMFKHK